MIAFSFAPVYAKEKAGINTYAEHVCWRRRDRVFEFGCRHCGVRALTGWRACFLFCLSAILEARFAVVAETGHPIFGAGAESLYSGGINIPPHTAQNAQKTAFAPHCFR